MPSIYQLKPRFQALLRPLNRGLVARGITANQVTVFAAVLSIAVGAAIALTPGRPAVLLLLPPLLLIRMALNAIDGMLAREHGMQSRLGALLNELGDVVSDAALYLPLALVPGLSAPLVVLLVVLAVIGEMAGALGPTLGASRRYDGPLGKSDRAFLFGVLGLLIGMGVPTGAWVDVVLAVAVALAAWTVVNRGRAVLAEGRGR